MLRTKSRMSEAVLRHGTPSSGSLRGLERSVPPMASRSARNSITSRRKPVPSANLSRPTIDRNSSSESTGLDDLFKMYQARDNNQPIIAPELKASRSTCQQRRTFDQPSIAPERQISALKSSLRSAPPRKKLKSRIDPRTEYGATRYRSASELPSPNTPDFTLATILSDSDIDENDMGKKYRDSLLPTPFGPAPVGNFKPAMDDIQLRNPKPLKSPPFKGYTRSNSDSPTPSMTISDLSSVEHSDSILTQDDRNAWYPQSAGTALSHSTSNHSACHSLGSYNSASNIRESTRLRPAPIPYDWAQQNAETFANLEISSAADSGSQYDSSPNLLPSPPPNWSRSLKPSNPKVHRVPRCERSPAVGLSDYQADGQKAWAGQETIPGDSLRMPFAKRKYDSLSAPTQETESHREPIHRLNSGATDSLTKPLSSRAELQMNATYFPQINQRDCPRTDSRASKYPTVESISQSASNVGSRIKKALLSKISISKLKDIDISHSVAPRNSSKSSKRDSISSSWMVPWTEKLTKNQEAARRKDLKKRITILNVTDSTGVAGNTPILKTPPAIRSRDTDSWYAMNREVMVPPEDSVFELDGSANIHPLPSRYGTWI